ncbi:CerR family C-terminal domain-containing protein [Pseudoalteromonas sp. YIC-656]|uniref:TetR/AcrR family transcriptional regulator n=1 Tax=Pseudoalteromonas pernae TaxID=3118054 RepID=UPI003242A5DA
MPKQETSSRKDGALTHQRILNTAGRLFATQGLGATKNKDIAIKAEVDLALINYHFGGRDGLYQHTLKEAHAHIIKLEDLLIITEQSDSPEAQLKSVIDLLTKAVLSPNDWHFKLLARELLSPSASLKVLADEEGLPKINIIKTILSNLTGIAADDPSIFPCVISVMAPCLMILVAGENLPGPLQAIRSMEQQQLSNYLFNYALGGLNAVKNMQG